MSEPSRPINGSSPAAQQIRKEIARIAKTLADVLIYGESGTGKERVARGIHEQSQRAKGPFVALSCAALPEVLCETLLFGCVKGAYTDARDKKGAFRDAHGGTLFLDEIAQLSWLNQGKLLRVLQEREVLPVGGKPENIFRFDVRVIFATNQDLVKDVETRAFREDLYYRVYECKIETVPLRDRGDDINELIAYFLATFTRDHGKEGIALSGDALERLRGHSWPGNVRELEKTIKRAVINCEDRIIYAKDVSFIPAPGKEDATSPQSSPPVVISKAPGTPAHMGPPRPGDPDYERIDRPALVERVLEDHLKRERVAVLLGTRRGGAKTLARQIARRYTSVAWLIAAHDLPAECTAAEFYRQLTRDGVVYGRDGKAAPVSTQGELCDWLNQTDPEQHTLVVLYGTRGPEELLGQVASALLNIRQDCRRSFAILIVGGKHLLQLRSVQVYSWHRLIYTDSYFDVPDLAVEEIGRLLQTRQLPERFAQGLHRATGGHPWLLYKLLTTSGQSLEEPGMTRKVRELIELDLRRQLSNPQVRGVFQRLLGGEVERVARIGERRVRWDPDGYVESQLFFDKYLISGTDGTTQFRCPAVQIIVEEELSSGNGLSPVGHGWSS